MTTPLLLMYLLSVAIGAMSFVVSRGPDGKLMVFSVSFALIAIVYVGLAWITRHQPIWLHVGAHLLLFAGAAALGMLPKPNLDGMAGMLYMFIYASIIGMVLLACVARLVARWV